MTQYHKRYQQNQHAAWHFSFTYQTTDTGERINVLLLLIFSVFLLFFFFHKIKYLFDQTGQQKSA
jgi:uncharacterized membrane protein